jgi:hypothetical protein
MATNFYFNNFPTNQITSEQLLVEDLVIEAMQVYGMDVYYLPRTTRDPQGQDNLFGEDTLKQYRSAYSMEMYLENVSGMDGEGDFISKFGLEIRDEVTLLVSRRRFAATVPQLRPHEGDLIYIPLVQNFFELTFVEHENDQAMFYTLGRGRGGNVYVYALKLKQYVFSEEVIDTGIDEVDGQAFDAYKKTRLPIANTGSGSFIPNEIIYQGTNLANSTAQAVVYSYTPNSEVLVVRMQGYFSNNQILTGNSSNASRTLIYADEEYQVGSNMFEDISDNAQIQNEADDILDFSTTNPFGEP